MQTSNLFLLLDASPDTPEWELQCTAKYLQGLPEVGLVHCPAFRPFAATWSWISRNSQGMVVFGLWAVAPFVVSEIACHQALGLPVWELDEFRQYHDQPEKLAELRLPPLMEIR